MYTDLGRPGPIASFSANIFCMQEWEGTADILNIPSGPNDVGSTLIQRQTMTLDQRRNLVGFVS